MASTMVPKIPKNLPPHTERCLRALAAHDIGNRLSLGGALGLLCYHDYRSTNDIDAWWDEKATTAERDHLVAVLRETLAEFGAVRMRTWGDVVSIELLEGSKKVFSFQIATRSARLDPAAESPWKGIPLDSFDDLLANKMIALVERGAPRDFRDVHAVCQNDLATPARCWELWKQRQALAGADCDPKRARLAVETHLARIVRYRPLDKIQDPTKRSRAKQARGWYRTELLHALVD